MATRSHTKTKTISEIPVAARRAADNSWVLMLKESTFKDNNNFSIISLPNPATGEPSKYCLDDANNKIFEVVVYNEPHRSWFIGETVKSDGTLYMLTPMNPTFLVLPRIRDECTDKAVPLDDLLSGKGYDRIFDFVQSLEHVCDLKGPADMKAYKYNEEKTLQWLESRVRRVAKVLRAKQVHVTSGAVSATFVTSSVNSDSIDEEFYLRYSHGLVSEYLQDDLMESLAKRFNFKPELVESLAKKRKSEAEGNGIKSKKIKSEPKDEDHKENTMTSPNQSFENKAKSKTTPLTNKEKARQKAASGSKTISSFFVKK